MSNALAIAAVTAVLRDLLNNAVIDHDLSARMASPVNVTALPPDRIKVGDDEQPQLNVFLYYVTPNCGWSNVALPSRDPQGTRLTNPPLALDLYYLLTAYGKNDFEGEILLGYAMQMLHETPVLPRASIRTALGKGPRPDGTEPVTSGILPIGPLSAADLADQVEQIKIAPQPMSTEEVSKLWTALQAHYRPTATYHISVVLIESSKPAKAPLPVTQRNLLALQFRQPFIDEVTPQMVLPGQAITIRGTNLKAERTKLNFGLAKLSEATPLSDAEIVATLPLGLLAGINSVQIVQELDFGTPADPHRGFESNVAPFLLAPQIATQLPISVQRGQTLTLELNPAVGRSQRATLLVGERSIAAEARTTDDPTTTLSFAIPADFQTGDFIVRVQIDGAQSPVKIDKGQIVGPKIKVTP
jgi:hypothetical protein